MAMAASFNPARLSRQPLGQPRATSMSGSPAGISLNRITAALAQKCSDYDWMLSISLRTHDAAQVPLDHLQGEICSFMNRTFLTEYSWVATKDHVSAILAAFALRSIDKVDLSTATLLESGELPYIFAVTVHAEWGKEEGDFTPVPPGRTRSAKTKTPKDKNTNSFASLQDSVYPAMLHTARLMDEHFHRSAHKALHAAIPVVRELLPPQAFGLLSHLFDVPNGSINYPHNTLCAIFEQIRTMESPSGTSGLAHRGSLLSQVLQPALGVTLPDILLAPHTMIEHAQAIMTHFAECPAAGTETHASAHLESLFYHFLALLTASTVPTPIVNAVQKFDTTPPLDIHSFRNLALIVTQSSALARSQGFSLPQAARRPVHQRLGPLRGSQPLGTDTSAGFYSPSQGKSSDSASDAKRARSNARVMIPLTHDRFSDSQLDQSGRVIAIEFSEDKSFFLDNTREARCSRCCYISRDTLLHNSNTCINAYNPQLCPVFPYEPRKGKYSNGAPASGSVPTSASSSTHNRRLAHPQQQSYAAFAGPHAPSPATSSSSASSVSFAAAPATPPSAHGGGPPSHGGDSHAGGGPRVYVVDDYGYSSGDSYYSKPGHMYSTLSRPLLSSAIFDTACSPYHCFRPDAPGVHITRLSDPSSVAISTSHAHTAVHAQACSVSVLTRTSAHAPLRLTLPGITALSSHFSLNLVSGHQLLLAGFHVSLHSTHGTLFCPDGSTSIPLLLWDGLWVFPLEKDPSPTHPPLALAVTRSQAKRPPLPSHALPVLQPSDEPMALTSESLPLTPCVDAAQPLSPASGPPPPSGSDSASPSPTPSSHLDKWTALHNVHAHAGWRRLRKLALGMQETDPDRPSLRYLTQWRKTYHCSACTIGSMQRPSHAATHPSRAPAVSPRPGESLYIDSTGSYAQDHDNASGQVLGSFSHSWIFVDEATHVIHSIPGLSATCAELLQHIQHYQATSGVPLRSMFVDLAYKCEPLQSWCDQHNVKLEACPKHAHAQNSLAEFGVKTVKSLSRTNNAQAGTPTARLQPYAHQCAAQQYNRTPTSSGPSPLSLWPSAPWQRPSLQLHPWGCRAFGYVGKDSSAPNTAMRGAPGIFVGIDTFTSAYLVYHEDLDTLRSYAYITAVDTSFPIKDLQRAGELSPPDGSINPDSWRRHAPRKLVDVQDGPAAEFLVGKQVLFDLPPNSYPNSPLSWRVRCQSVVYVRSPPIVAVRCFFVSYSGGDDSLDQYDRSYSTQFIDIPMSDVPPTAVPNDTLVSFTSVRKALLATYPSFSTLADLAQASSILHGHPVLPPILDTGTSALAIRPRVTRVLLPARRVGLVRSSSATWTPILHHILPSRMPLKVVSPVLSSTIKTSSRHAPPFAVLLPAHACGAVGFEPRTLKQARAHPSWDLWDAAIQREMDGLRARHTWDEVLESSLPSTVKPIPSKLIFKDKHFTGAKARLCVRGDLQNPKPPASETYSGTPSAPEVRTLFSHAVQQRWSIHSVDISQAFLQAHDLPPDQHIYIRPPPGLGAPPGVVWKLRKFLYGLSAAPRAWTDTLRSFLLDYGFQPVNSSQCLMHWHDGTDTINLCFHVDDILFSFSDADKGQQFKAALLSRFIGTDDGPVSRYLGMDVLTSPSGSVMLSQEPLTKDLIEEFGLADCNPAATPLPPATLLLDRDGSDPVDPLFSHLYSHLVGSLTYLATWTRPDIAFPVSQLARHLKAPGHKHLAAAKHVLRYLKGTSSLGVLYSPDMPDANRLISFSDADWATCPDTRRSVGAFVHLLNGGAIAWKTKLQGGVSSSTTEAEFVSASKTADDLAWIRRTLDGLGLPQPTPTPLYIDNRSARALAQSPAHRERTKHIDFRVFALRDRVASGVVHLVDCPSGDMLADILTKNLPSPAFTRHRQTMLGFTPHSAPALPSSLQLPCAGSGSALLPCAVGG